MANATIDKVAFKSPADMIAWQLREIIAELQELQRHAADPTCPCVAHDNGENCLMKHALGVRTLAAETAIMYPLQRTLFTELGEEALTQHLALKGRIVCGEDHEEEKDTEEWARNWRKRIEPLYYSCSGSKPLELHRETRPNIHRNVVEMFAEPHLYAIIAKIRKASDPRKKTELWQSLDLLRDDYEKIVRGMVLSLPAGYYKLHDRKYGTNIVDTMYDTYGVMPSMFVNESMMLGLQALYPEKVYASFTLGLDAIEIKKSRKAIMHKNAVEKACTICETSKGKLVLGNQATGTEDKVSLSPACPGGSKIAGIWHRHPGEYAPEPSAADISETQELNRRHGTGKTMCITGMEPAPVER